MWNRKPVEELYDLKNDPHELVNLAENPEYKDIKEQLNTVLIQNALDMRDAGFLMEPEMMQRGAGSTVYEMAQDKNQYDLPSIIKAAGLVGVGSENDFIKLIKNKDSGVRFWGVMGLRNLDNLSKNAENQLRILLKDKSPTVQIGAAEIICLKKEDREALGVLSNYLNDERLYVKLYAARSIEQIGTNAATLIPQIKAEMDKLTVSKNADETRKYKDFNLASFTGWTLENALLKNNITY